MGGKVHISVYVFSVTISFGSAAGTAPPPLHWIDGTGTGFAQSLLPHAAASTSRVRVRAAAGAPAAAGDSSVQPASICVVTPAAGLLTTFTQGQQTIWVVRPDAFVFSLSTAIPATEIAIASGTGGTTAVTPPSPYTVCVRPMKATLTSSTLAVSMTDDEAKPFDLAAHCDFAPLLRSVPAAKWGPPLATDADLEPNAVLPGRLMGLTTITAKAPVLTPSGASALDIAIATAFAYDIVDEETPYTPSHLPLDAAATPADTPPVADEGIVDEIRETLMSDTVAATRAAIFASLQILNVNAGTNGPMTVFAANPAAWLSGDPLAAATS
jgi:hypothetical protein